MNTAAQLADYFNSLVMKGFGQTLIPLTPEMIDALCRAEKDKPSE